MNTFGDVIIGCFVIAGLFWLIVVIFFGSDSDSDSNSDSGEDK